MLKVIIHAQRNQRADHPTYKPGGEIQQILEALLDQPIEFKSFRGLLDQEQLEELVRASQDADLVILDHETYPNLTDWQDWWGKDPDQEALKAGQAIKENCPEASLYALTNNWFGPDLKPIHQIAQPTRSYTSSAIVLQLRTQAA